MSDYDVKLTIFRQTRRPAAAGTADEVAEAAGLLLGPRGAFITGADLLIDGGATASYFYGPLNPQSGS